MSQENQKGIDPRQVRALLNKLKTVEADNRALRDEVTKLKAANESRQVASHVPGSKRAAKAQTVRAQLFADIDAGTVTALGRSAIKARYGVGDATAEYLQTEAVAAGMARRMPSGRVKLAA